MIYNILGCIIGVFALINTVVMFFARKEKIKITILNLICAIGFIGTGIVGFFIPEKFSMFPILFLFVFAVSYLILNTVILNQRKSSQAGKTKSSKK